MGQKVIDTINQNDDLQLVLAVDINKSENNELSQCPLVATLEDELAQNTEADCLIDFSFHTSAPEIAEFITKQEFLLSLRQRATQRKRQKQSRTQRNLRQYFSLGT